MKRKSFVGNPLTYILARVIAVYLLVGVLTRIFFMVFSPEGATYTVLQVVKLMCFGFVNDLCMSFLLSLPFVLFHAGMIDAKYKKWPGTILLALLLTGIIYVFFTHSIFHEYGGFLPEIAQTIFVWFAVSFALRLFFPAVRSKWRRISMYLFWGTYLFLLYCNAIGEWFFWDEFGVRYNFIAVDYLIYTYEVVGNIMESYAIVPLLVLVALVTVGTIWLFTHRDGLLPDHEYTLRGFAVQSGILAVLAGIGLFWLTSVAPRFEEDNVYVNQLQQNGAYDFLEAFYTHELNYEQFYALLPEDECRQTYHALCDTDQRLLTDTIADQWKDCFSIDVRKPNIVLITVESLSASFFTSYGNTEGITPHLDELMHSSLVFDSLYAVGNRTVRGLEALSLCLPPCAGESVVKTSRNRMGDLSAGAVFRKMGYRTQFLYGGDSYFDNMGDFFGKNQYDVIDRKQIPADSIVFANIWGVSDEDLYNKAISVFDTNGEPFFAQLMTTSNHRPYTFPENRIEFDGDTKCRSAAVKYTDYAIGHFLSEASKHSWYDNTIFIIIADHCAASAGKVSIPIDKYHIPCLLYAPKLIKPARIKTVCSQIDIIPTILAIIGQQVPTGFSGRNVLSPTYTSRAFMATYQDLAYYKNGKMVVLSPNRKVQQYRIVTNPDGTHTEVLTPTIDPLLQQEAQAYYQYVNLYIKGEE